MPNRPRRAGAKFQISDGVGCEACHGGAGGWLVSHYTLGATHADNVEAGMTALEDPRDPRRRVPGLPFRQRRAASSSPTR